MKYFYGNDMNLKTTRLSGAAALLLSIFTLVSHPADALVTDADQTDRIVSGIVVDSNREPIVGASVVVKGTTEGTATDVNGYFEILVDDDDVLEVSFLGFSTTDVTVGKSSTLNITLREDMKFLDEVVVVGYGTQRKGEVASAIASVKAEDFIATPTNDAIQLVKGKIPGLQVNTIDANPTSSSEISLRGITTLSSSTSPLVLIDGIPGDLNTVSPSDIEQIDVLKDGSAAAIYGTRGTNGVILVTTKKGKLDTPAEVDFNASVSTQQITRTLPFLNAEEYRQLVAQGVPGTWDDGANTDWLDEVMRTPVSQIYNVSLKGGGKNTNYVASFEYRGLQGIMKQSNTNVLYPRIEITHRMFDNMLKINAGVSGYQRKYHVSGDGSSFNTEIYRNALIYNPTTPIYQEDGSYSYMAKNAYDNPVALLEEGGGEHQKTYLRMYSDITLTPIEGLDIKALVSSSVYNSVEGYYETSKHPNSIRATRTGFASRGTVRTQDDLLEVTAQYRKTIEGHSFSVMAGYGWQKNHHQFYWMQNYDFPADETTYNNMGTGAALKAGDAEEYSYAQEDVLVSFFGRINYSYKDRYVIAASLRHEGSSKFGANHKWGNFPSVSVAWNVANEPFMEDADFLTALKLRAGYGVTGTIPTDPYMSLSRVNLGSWVYFNGEWMQFAEPSSNANPELRWEKKKEFNIGVDFGFLNDRITGSFDYYNRNTVDLIWNYTVPLPPYMYSTMTANAGSMRNEGFEIGLNFIPVQTRDFQWVSQINYSTNSNVLTSLSNDSFISSGYSDQGSTGEPLQQSTHRIQEGQPIGNFYGYKAIDIDDTGHWIIEGKDGQPKSVNDAVPEDKQVIGNGLPKHYLNFNNSFTYKGFDLSITMRGAFGYDILNMPRLQYGAPSMLSRGNVLKEAFEPKFGKVALATDQALAYVDYYLEKGDYWKIDNVTLGYTFNFNTWVKRLRIYAMVQNLATITGYSGIDPEVSVTGLAPGVDNKNRYPMTRTFTLGVSVKF